MGSAFAGVKAGILSGLVFAGSLGLYNVLLLYLLKPDVLKFVASGGYCGPGTSGNSISPEDCFSAVVAIYIPYFTFLVFIISLIFAAAYGRFFEYIPGRGYRTKSTLIALAFLVVLLVLGLGGLAFEFAARISSLGFNLFITLVYGAVLGVFYKRYTRIVEFVSPDTTALRIEVDGKNYTGKKKTLSMGSTHKVKAVTTTGSSFKEWLASGGVSIEDPRSFETTIEIGGDGILKAAFVSSQQNR